MSQFGILCFCIATVTAAGAWPLLINTVNNKLPKVVTSLGWFLIGFGLAGYAILLFGTKHDTEVVHLNHEEVALNAYGRPMYDMISASNNDHDKSGTQYKVYLASGKTKKVAPKVVHVNRSKTSYLKAEKKKDIVYVLNIPVENGIHTDYTLYLNDKR